MERKILKKKITECVEKYLGQPHYKVFFFGSRVTGNADSRSDYDVGIQAGVKIPGNVLEEIRSELEELPILQKIDVVDFYEVTENFRSAALQQIEVIHEK